MTKAKRIKETLTPDQLDFYKQKTISDTRKIKEWISFFRNLALLDKTDDRNHNIYKGFTVTGIVGLIASIIYMANVKEVWIVGLIILSMMVIGFGYHHIRRLDEEDINNYLRLFFFPILKTFKDKAGAEAKLSATLDFRDSKASSPS